MCGCLVKAPNSKAPNSKAPNSKYQIRSTKFQIPNNESWNLEFGIFFPAAMRLLSITWIAPYIR